MLAAALLLMASEPAAECSVITFSREPSFKGMEQVGVCLDRSEGAFDGHYLFRLTASAPRRSAVTSTRTCPAARAQLSRLQRLKLPAPNVPFLGRELESAAFDGSAYRLESDANYRPGNAHLVVESNVRTPLARWIDATLAILAPCWRDTIRSPAPPPT